MVRVYKQLKMAERAYRTIKDALDVRPSVTTSENLWRRTSSCSCSPTTSCLSSKPGALDALCRRGATDANGPGRATQALKDRQDQGRKPPHWRRAPAHSLEDLIKDLGTRCRNTVRIGDSPYTFTRLTTPTELQLKAFELLGINPGK